MTNPVFDTALRIKDADTDIHVQLVTYDGTVSVSVCRCDTDQAVMMSLADFQRAAASVANMVQQ